MRLPVVAIGQRSEPPRGLYPSPVGLRLTLLVLLRLFAPMIALALDLLYSASRVICIRRILVLEWVKNIRSVAEILIFVFELSLLNILIYDTF